MLHLSNSDPEIDPFVKVLRLASFLWRLASIFQKIMPSPMSISAGQHQDESRRQKDLRKFLRMMRHDSLFHPNVPAQLLSKLSLIHI